MWAIMVTKCHLEKVLVRNPALSVVFQYPRPQMCWDRSDAPPPAPSSDIYYIYIVIYFKFILPTIQINK